MESQISSLTILTGIQVNFILMMTELLWLLTAMILKLNIIFRWTQLPATPFFLPIYKALSLLLPMATGIISA